MLHEEGPGSGKKLQSAEHTGPAPVSCLSAGLCVCPQHSARLEKEEQPVQNPCRTRKRRENLNMENLYNENEGKLEIEGRPEDEVEPEDEEKSDEEEKLEMEGKPGYEGKLQSKGQPDDEGQLEDEGKQEKQGKSENEGKPHSEGKPESLAKPEGEPRAAEKRPAEDYVPRKAKRKTDRGTDDSPKDYQENLRERHLGSEEMMRECGDMSRAQEELRKKQKMGGFHWMQRDVPDPFAPRGQRGVRGIRGGGRGQRGLHDIPYL
ncbi:transcription elongation factor A protein-like 3 isoform X1 [Ursus americanus]|nr:transcription elongation factor A protein-like 3 isoform X1 [Ursus americanus]